MIDEIIFKLEKYFMPLIFPSIFDTLKMLIITMILATIFGFAIGTVLILTRNGGLHSNPIVFNTIKFCVDFIRSFPIMILIVALLPLTKIIMGTSIGVRGAIFPLTITATPFMARIFQNAMMEVDPQLIEAAQSFGASNRQIIFKVILREAIPSIVSGTTLATVTYLSATTIAGAIGAGGLGSVAMNYGYNRFDKIILYTAVIILCILVQLIQLIGNSIYKKL